MLNTAIDLLSNRTRSPRSPKFKPEAENLLELITGEENPQVELATDEDKNDEDWFEEPLVVGSGHVVSLETMRKIIDMREGTNGQRQRSLDSIATLPLVPTKHDPKI